MVLSLHRNHIWFNMYFILYKYLHLVLFKSKWTGWINTNCRKSENLMIWTNNFETALFLSSSFFLNALSFLYSGGRPTVQTCGKWFQKLELFHEVITCGCIMFFFNNNLLSSPHSRIVKSAVLGRRRRCTTPERSTFLSFEIVAWIESTSKARYIHFGKIFFLPGI